MVTINQYRIIETSKELQVINCQFVADYNASPDGVMTIPERPEIPADVKPLVSDWFTHPALDWHLHNLNCHYFNGKKPISLK